MRGRFDDAIEAKQAADVAVGRRRPPGGKVLVRLLQLLESAGYTELANARVRSAVSGEEAREQWREYAEQIPGLPGGETSPAAETDEAATAEAVARMYLEVGEQLAPPTPTGPQWRSLGPWTIPNGQTYGSSRVNVSGRISTIAIDPSNPAACGRAGIAGAAGRPAPTTRPRSRWAR